MRSAIRAAPLLLLLFAQAISAQVRLAGRVIGDNKVAVFGAQLALSPAVATPNSSQLSTLETLSDPTGAFSFEVAAPGKYRLSAQKQGYFASGVHSVDLVPGENAAAVVLSPLREIHESIDVTYSPPMIDFEKTSVAQSITGNDIVSVPYPSTHSLRNALRILPGAVVQDAAGDIHFNSTAVR